VIHRHDAAQQELKPVLQAMIDVVENDSEAIVRIRAASYLSGLGARAKAALPALQKAAADADLGIAKYAREAVARITGATEVDAPDARTRNPQAEALRRLERARRRASKPVEPEPKQPKPKPNSPEPSPKAPPPAADPFY
jgi:hypothetical protein